MVGFNEEGHQVPQFCDKNNQLIIKLVNKIYNNWKLPIKFQ